MANFIKANNNKVEGLSSREHSIPNLKTKPLAPDAPKQPVLMKSWKKWVGTGTGILFSGYFLFFALKTFSAHDISALLKTDCLLAIICAALLNALLVPLAGLAWSILLHSMGSHWKATQLIAIIGFTQIAKYVPGNIAQHIGRTTIALINGMPSSLFLSSVLAESVLLLSASVFIGSLSISLSPIPIPAFDLQSTNIINISICILVASAVVVPVLIKYMPHLVRRFSHTQDKNSLTIPAPTAGAAAQAFALYCLSYLVLGFSLWIIATRHGGLDNVNIFSLTASFTLAWLAGYLTPGAPAGLGVREGALVLLLANTGPAEHVLTVVIAARFATILSDAISFAFSAYLMKSEKNENLPGA